MSGFSRASLTVECALALPIFFLALVTLIGMMSAMMYQLSANLDTSNQARQLAVLSSALSVDDDCPWIDIRSAKTYPFPISLIPSLDMRLAVRARVYPWVGETPSEAASAENDDTMVYVTENREVYHTHSDCTHLQISIVATTTENVGGLRNSDGKKYKPCEGFPKGYQGVIYVTTDGDYYYPSTSYNSLTRHVRMVRLSEAAGLPLCSRCAARK